MKEAWNNVVETIREELERNEQLALAQGPLMLVGAALVMNLDLLTPNL